MPSPFPGMDPFLESQEWEDFHVTFVTALSDQLTEQSAPNYVARVNRRSYYEGNQERRETYLLIREREALEVITVIEVLSPANKRRGGEGWRVYQRKRDEVLASESHLVELDLLRGGERLPMVTPLPRGDYYAIVSRRMKRPRAQVTAWTLRDRLPTIAIPLKEQDGDVPLDLQEVFTTVYDRARYHLSLNYAAELVPPLGADESQWIGEATTKAVGSRQ